MESPDIHMLDQRQRDFHNARAVELLRPIDEKYPLSKGIVFRDFPWLLKDQVKHLVE